MTQHYLKIALLSAMVASFTPVAHADSVAEREKLYQYKATHNYNRPEKVAPVVVSDEEMVRHTLDQWIAGVNNHSLETLTRLYDTNAVLQTAICTKLHNTPEMRIRYFSHLLSAPHLRAVLTQSQIRVMGDTAIVDGAYTFTYGKHKKIVNIPERFSMVLAKKGDGWIIVDHHASILPKKRAKSNYYY